MSTTPLTTRLCYSLLDVDEDQEVEPRWSLIRAARRGSWSLPSMLLSIFESEGHALSLSARNEIDGMRARRALYGTLADRVAAQGRARVVKGPSLAALYPEGVLRPAGDLDLVVPDEVELWRGVRVVTDAVPDAHVDVTVFGRVPQHLLVVLTWPSPDPYLEPPHQVELSTAAFAGDLDLVGIRPQLPDNQGAADLLALAEERFQRPFKVRDLLDIAVLAGADRPPPDDLLEIVGSYMLAPELTELFTLAGRHVGLGHFEHLLPRLEAMAAQELARRDRCASSRLASHAAESPAESPVVHRGGLVLNRHPWREQTVSQQHDFEGGTLLFTPVGDYLLVKEEVVSVSLFERALDELSRVSPDDGVFDEQH